MIVLMFMFGIVSIMVMVWAVVRLIKSRWLRWLGYGVVAVSGASTAAFLLAAVHNSYGAVYAQCVATFQTGTEPENVGRLMCSFADLVFQIDPKIALFLLGGIGLIALWIVNTRYIRPSQPKFKGGGVVAEIFYDKRYLAVSERGAIEPLIIDFGTLIARAETEFSTTNRTVYVAPTITGVSGGSIVNVNRGGSYDVTKHRRTGNSLVFVDSISVDEFLDRMGRSDGKSAVDPRKFYSVHNWLMPTGEATALMRWFKHHQSLLAFDPRAMKAEWTKRMTASLAAMRQQFGLPSKDLLETYKMEGACEISNYIAMDGRGWTAIFLHGLRWTFEPHEVVLDGNGIRLPDKNGGILTTVKLTQDMLRRLERVRRTTR